MPLTNSQYDTIMREYDNIRTANQHTLNERYEEVYSALPQLKDLDSQIINISVDAAKSRILGQLNSNDLSQKLTLLNSKKESLLNSIGIPSGYLDEIYTCPACRDTGYIGQERCTCFKKKAIDLVYRDSNLKNITDSENFNTFSYEWYKDDIPNPANGRTPLGNIRKAVSVAKDFTANFDREFSNILFYGNTGTGKTFLSNCIARELLDTSHSVIYLTAIEFFDKLSKRDNTKDFNRYSSNPYSDYTADYLTECDLLIIDDLGTEINNAYTTSKLFYIINERILRKKSVVISTNLSLGELRDMYSERIFSRITSSYKFIYIFGDDIRTLKVTRNR